MRRVYKYRDREYFAKQSPISSSIEPLPINLSNPPSTKPPKRLETMKTDSTAPKIFIKKSKMKKIDRVETSLKEPSCDLSLFKFKSSVVVALVLFVVFAFFLNNLFEGKEVAKLPFVPVRIVQKMSHRGLQGDDYTDCLMEFLYFLCSISIRTNLQKFLGFSPPRGAAGTEQFWAQLKNPVPSLYLSTRIVGFTQIICTINCKLTNLSS
ncbi:hypothetical protein LguiA_028636 [Lonicera macranthoides]